MHQFRAHNLNNFHNSERISSADKKYIDGACVLTDSDGDKIFSTFDTRDTDKSQPQMNCGTHIITGGTGKYKGITGSEPFACISMPALTAPGGYTAMDIRITRRGRLNDWETQCPHRNHGKMTDSPGRGGHRTRRGFRPPLGKP